MPDVCQLERSPSPDRAFRFLVSLLGSLAFLPACGRTGLDSEGFDDTVEHPGPIGTEPAEASIDAKPTTDAACVPTTETCNGLDDDCNGAIDEGLAPTPCPGGGERYCVAGRWSACPDRCNVCIPGSQVVCFHSYCLYWGVMTCAADGKGFGPCREDRPPPECDRIARDNKDSPELERCCTEHGYCCTDSHDLDGDGNRSEVLGACNGVVCRP